MKAPLPFYLFTCLLFASCSSAAPVPTTEPITVQYTAAAAPWLATLYNCAGSTLVTADQRAADFLDPQSVDLSIRLGQPDNLTSPAYQIGTDDLLVIINQQNPIKQLTTTQVQGLFSGQIQNWKEAGGSDTAVQVWAYAAAEDLQSIFNQTVLDGSPVTSTARLASSPGEMIQAIVADANAVGILNRRLLMSNVSDAYSVTTVPVLALTKPDPQGSVGSILACLQK